MSANKGPLPSVTDANNSRNTNANKRKRGFKSRSGFHMPNGYVYLLKWAAARDGEAELTKMDSLWQSRKTLLCVAIQLDQFGLYF